MSDHAEVRVDTLLLCSLFHTAMVEYHIASRVSTVIFLLSICLCAAFISLIIAVGFNRDEHPVIVLFLHRLLTLLRKLHKIHQTILSVRVTSI